MNTLKELYAYREMIFNLVRKDLRGRYKGSVLGFLWTFINPLLQLLVYTFVFSMVLRFDIEKYYLFLFVALIPWLFFSTSLVGGSNCIISQKDLVKKIYFPRQVIPIAHVTASFVNMLFCFIVIFVVVMISGVGINILAIMYLPIIMIVQFVFCLGMAMLSSSVTVYFRDLEHILGIVVMAWQYLTPILYSVDMIPEKFLPIFNFNPMTPIITAYRDVLFYTKTPEIFTLIHAFLLGLVVLIVGWILFNKLQKHFAEEL